MDKLPHELLEHVAFMACTDGGITGSSLSLVSKRVRETTRYARYYSVALVETPEHVRKFLDALNSVCAQYQGNPPHVSHLLLSLFGRYNSEPIRTDELYDQLTAAASFEAAQDALRKTLQRLADTQDAIVDGYAQVLPSFFQVIAPKLRSLVLLQSKSSDYPFNPVCFPMLRELTTTGGDPKFARFKHVADDTPSLYPELRRLHHILHWVIVEQDDVDYVPWSKHAPKLTHLRVSRLPFRPQVTIDTLIRVYSEVPEDEALFPNIQRVLVSLQAPTQFGVTSDALQYYILADQIEEAMENTRAETTRLDDYEEIQATNFRRYVASTIERALDVWLDWLEGDEGYWDVDFP